MSYLSRDFIKNLLLIVVVGFVAGALGAVAIWSMVLAYQTELVTGRGERPSLRARRAEVILETKIIEVIEEQIIPSVVDFWNAPSGSSLRGTFYLPEDAVGHGIVLTTDGWIAAPHGVLPRDRARFRVGVGPAVVTPVSYLLDTETDILFIKVQGANLNAARFAETIPSAGQWYAAPDAQGIAPIDVLFTRPEGIVSSDALTARIVFDRAFAKEAIGAPLVGKDGTVAGMIVSQNTALPIVHITSILRSLLTDGKLTRPALGVRGMQLSGARVEGSGRERGFLLRSDARTGARAVARKSPAETAGLKEGDSILKINETIVNGKRSLADMLLDFRPGDTVDLRIVRGDEEVVLSVTLGERQSGKSL